METVHSAFAWLLFDSQPVALQQRAPPNNGVVRAELTTTVGEPFGSFNNTIRIRPNSNTKHNRPPFEIRQRWIFEFSFDGSLWADNKQQDRRESIRRTRSQFLYGRCIDSYDFVFSISMICWPP